VILKRGAAAVASLTLLLAACATEPVDPGPAALPGSSGPVEPVPAVPAPEDEAPQGFLSEQNQRRVYLFFPTDDAQRLVAEERIIFLTTTLTSQVKQAVSELLLGPQTLDLIPAFPPNTRLRAVFLLPDGTAVIDLGPLAVAIPAGTASERAAVYSLVNTVVHNFQEIRRVQILVEGEEIPTLVGHLDTSRPVGPDLDWVDWTRVGYTEGQPPPWSGVGPPPPQPIEEETIPNDEPLEASGGEIL